MSVDSNRKRIGEGESSDNALDRVFDGYQEGFSREEADESDRYCSAEDRQEKIRELGEERLAVMEELQRRRNRVELLSNELANLEHKAREAEVSRNFVCSTGVVLSSADAYAKRIRSELERVRRQEKHAQDELQRAVDREQLIRDEMQNLELKEDVAKVKNRQRE